MGKSTEQLKLSLIDWRLPYPLAQRLRVIGRFAVRRPHESDFALFGTLPYRSGVFLDVGANAGQSALSFHLYQPHCPIVSIEPNPAHAQALRFVGRLLPAFRFVQCAAGAERATSTLYVPSYRGVPLTGYASLDRGELEGPRGLRQLLDERAWRERVTIVAHSVKVLPLDELELDPAFVKVDIEGREGEAVAGLIGTIARHRPVIQVESTAFADVRDLLAPLDYLAIRFDGRRGAVTPIDDLGDRPPLNVFFMPAESLPEARA